MFERVLELQSEYDSTTTPAMVERGKLIRNEIPGWLRANAEQELSGTLETSLDDLLIQGRDLTGRRSRVPWVRVARESMSPSPTDGFYVVYGFAANGKAVYLSLNQGTTTTTATEYVPKPPEVVARRAVWGREIAQLSPGELDGEIILDERTGSLGEGYARGSIAHFRYPKGSIPSNEQLLEDLILLCGYLAPIYDANESAPAPGEEPEVVIAAIAADEAAGNGTRTSAGGFRMNARERTAIERHAVALARARYVDAGWKVRELGKPFDLKATKDKRQVDIEVKGTASAGEAVVLTRNEVDHHRKAFPNNSLIVVSGIELDRSGDEPTASGGQLREIRGWEISDDALTVISYRYAVPTAKLSE